MPELHDVTESPEHMPLVRQLFREYAAEIGIDLGFQGFERELADLPGCYAEPQGCILLAMEDDVAVGCVALRPLQPRVCEIKRLYVRPSSRGSGAGAALAGAILDTAFEYGYQRVLLDTLAGMTAARRLYESLGFAQTQAYYDNPLPDVIYYQRDFMAEARAVVAASAHEIGTGSWALVVYDDGETTIDFVHMVLCGHLELSAPVAEAVVHLAHLHGSAIARRFADRAEAQAAYGAVETFIIQSPHPLRIGLIELRPD